MHGFKLASMAAGSFLVAALTTVPSEAFAYKYFKCSDLSQTTTTASSAIKWKDTKINLKGRAQNFPSSQAKTDPFPTSYRRAFQDVVFEWTLAPLPGQVTVTFSEFEASLGNKVSEVWGTDTCNSGGGCANIFGTCSAGITEADIRFDATPTRPWTTQDLDSWLFAYGGNNQGFQTAALHEVGHALGLFESTSFGLMGDPWRHYHGNGSRVYTYIGEDDAHGVVTLYGAGSNKGNELGVSHWRKSGLYSNGLNALHGFANLYTSSGSPIAGSKLAGAGDVMVYPVTNGQTVQVGFMFENTGRSSVQNVTIQYVLSTTKEISTGSQRLNRFTGASLARDSASELKHTVNLPTGLTVNRVYYLGVVVDPDGQITEVHDGTGPTSGNASYIPIRPTR